MKISLTQISISDRVNAAKLAPDNTNTSSIPMEVDPSPGDSTITPVDTSGIDAAGANVNQQAQQGNKATSDAARKQNNPASQGLQYDKQELSAADQAHPVSQAKDITSTPQPKTKGFKASLIDAQLGSKMNQNSGGDHSAPDRDFGHNNGNPNESIKSAPESEPIRRNKMDPYDNSGNKVQEPKPFPITSFDRSPDVEPYKAPKQDLGPAYKNPGVATPKIRFNSPKINTPRFK